MTIAPSIAFIELKEEETEQSIGDRFEKTVVRYSNQLAVKDSSCELTYGELNETANRVAHSILSQHVGSGRPVALLLGHGAQIVAAILGVLKSGNFYVPLDPAFPHSRNEFILNDSQSSIVITNTENLSLAKQLVQDSRQLINIDCIDCAVADDNVGQCVSPDDLAYIMYTSGSTGQPKGVLQNHRNVLRVVRRYTNGVTITSRDRLTHLASFSVTASVSNMLGAILNGAALFLFNVKEEGVAKLADWIMTNDITVYHSVASVFRNFVVTFTGAEQFPKLRVVRLGGDRVYSSDVELYKNHFSDNCLFVNGYGASEISSVFQYCIDKNTPVLDEDVPVGWPLDETTFSLVDDGGKTLGHNAVGEIVLKSRSLSPGYWRKPELTRAVFQSDPQGDDDERTYHTGDMGYSLPNGCLVHKGRKDSQAKIRGFRVELGEIERVLCTVPAVKEAVVAAREDQFGENQLVAYVVSRSGSSLEGTELRHFLTAKLPDYMVPSVFSFLKALPSTPNGKLDRAALPAPVQGRPEAGTTLVAPRDTLEAQLTKIWEKVLRREPIGVRDDFFELGGHSLLAIQLVDQVGKVCGKTFPVIGLFKAPTVEKLAQALREDDPSRDWASVVPLQPNGSKPPFFFFAGRSHFGNRLGPDQPVYRVVYQDLDGDEVFVRIEDMAAHSVESVRTIQPDGPYYLGGHGLGGLVAFESARQLQRQGQKVALLTLCESRAPGSKPLAPNTSSAYRLWQRVRYHAQRARRIGPRQGLAHVLRGLKKKTRRAVSREGVPPTRTRQGHKSAAYEARRRYVPQAYSGRIAVVRCAERVPWRAEDPLNGWGSLATGDVEACEIPGSHTGIYKEPNVGMLASTLKDVLHKAQASAISEGLGDSVTQRKAMTADGD